MSDLITVALTTELDAVNAMLRSIMESPVDTLEDLSAPDAGGALAQLRMSSKAVQLIGWNWNTDEEYTLTPEAVTGNLVLPANTLKVILPDEQVLQLTQRGLRMYDRLNHTYTFTDPVDVTLVTGLDFSELPEAARLYIMLTATVIFQAGTVGSAQLDKFDRSAMQQALLSLEAAEAETGRYNMLTGNWGCFRIIQRRSPP